MKMKKRNLPPIYEAALEALKAAYTEIDAMMDTYEDYVPCGKLCEQIEEAIERLEGAASHER
jgi:hypothetical protein